MKAICVTLLLIMTFGLFAQTNVKLTTLDWPPYTSKDMVDHGLTTLIVKTAFKEMGYDLEADFFPWNRAVHLAKTNNAYFGYFPEYYSQDLEQDFYFSDPIGSGELGFIERADNPINWNSIDDLKKLHIGTVSGYVNEKTFDEKVARKEIMVDEANDDLTNIRKVVNKRISLAVIDKNVMNYLISQDKDLKNRKKEVQFNKKILELKRFYVCFKKTEEGKKMREILNEGLKKINIKKISEEYFANHLK